MCVDCFAPRDDAYHEIFHCHRWWRQRRDLEVKMEKALEPEAMVDLMLKNRDNWNVVEEFVSGILSKREEEERARQRAERYMILP